MQVFNFFENEYVGVADMMALQTVPQGAIKNILTSLINNGVITGVGVYPTSPTASLAVIIDTGKMILEDGSDVTTGTTVELDLSSYVAGLTTGQSAWAAIYGIPGSVSDTPVVTPAGTTILYRRYDSVEYVVVLGTPSTSTPAPTSVTPTGYTGILIADVLLSNGQTQITSGNISQTRVKTFVTIPYILGLINGIDNPPFPISDITGLQAALDGKMNIGAAIPESQVTNLVTNLATLTANIAALSATLSSDMATVNTTLTLHATEISTLNTEMTAVQGVNATQTSQITTLNSEVAANTSSISTLNGEVTTIQAFDAAFTYGSNSQGRWRKFPDGTIEQYILATGVTEGLTNTFTFPMTFPTGVWDIQLTEYLTGQSAPAENVLSVLSFTTSSVTITDYHSGTINVFIRITGN